MQKLIAKRNILYLGQMYLPGDRLPVNNPGIVAAWLAAESAVWKIVKESEKPLENAMPEIKNPSFDNNATDFNNESGSVDNENTDFNNESGSVDNETAKSGNGGTDQKSADPATGKIPANNAALMVEAGAVAELSKMTVPELRKRAAALGIDSSSARNKEQLIALLAAGGAK